MYAVPFESFCNTFWNIQWDGPDKVQELWMDSTIAPVGTEKVNKRKRSCTFVWSGPRKTTRHRLHRRKKGSLPLHLAAVECLSQASLLQEWIEIYIYLEILSVANKLFKFDLDALGSESVTESICSKTFELKPSHIPGTVWFAPLCELDYFKTEPFFRPQSCPGGRRNKMRDRKLNYLT